MAVFAIAPKVELVYPSFWRRTGAAIIDGVINLASILVMVAVVMLLDIRPTHRLYLCLAVLYVAQFLLYHAAFDSSRYRGTPGKMMLQLRVCTTLGAEVTFLRATGRATIKLIIGVLTGNLLSVVTIAVSRRAIHDMLTRTVVVRDERSWRPQGDSNPRYRRERAMS
jgi:uncharacterized RDD family membrane protein YckC